MQCVVYSGVLFVYMRLLVHMCIKACMVLYRDLDPQSFSDRSRLIVNGSTWNAIILNDKRWKYINNGLDNSIPKLVR